MHRSRILTTACLCLSLAAPVAAEWSDAFHLGADLNGAVVDAVEYDGGLVVCGPFTADTHGVLLNHVARWDAGWHPLGDGLTEAPACLSVHDGVLRAGGWRWNGAAWVRELPDGVEPAAMTFLDGDAIVALPGPLGTRLDRWIDPLLLPLGEADGEVRDLIVHDGDLVVAGAFRTIDGVASPNVARWSAASGWRSLGAGLEGERVGCCAPGGTSWLLDDSVDALLSDDGDLYAAGSFTRSGEDSLASIARYRDGAWRALGAGLDLPLVSPQFDGSEMVLPPQAFALALYRDHLYVGGVFAGAGGTASSGVVAWNGEAWTGVDGGVARTLPPGIAAVRSLQVHDDRLVAFGSFDRAGGNVVTDLASWNGASWKPGPGSSGLGLDGTVWVLQEWNGLLIAGGDFMIRGDAVADNLAAFDGGDWSLLGGSGPSGIVRALGGWEGDLIVGGDFSAIDGLTARRCARWNGSTWNALDTGLESVPYDFAAYDGALYACCGPATPDAPKPYGTTLCRWDDGAWTTIATTPYSGEWGAFDLHVFEGHLWFGDLYGIWRWDGTALKQDSTWRTFGFADLNGTLYAGIDGYPNGDQPGVSLHRRENGSWIPCGEFPDPNCEVRSLSVLDGVLYGGGFFPQVNDFAANHVFRLVDGRFERLDGGLGWRVYTVTTYGGSVWFGGEFTTAGGLPSHSIARWTPTVLAIEPLEPPDDPPPLPLRTGLVSVRPNPFNPSTRVTWSQERPGPVELAVYDLAGRRLAVLAAAPCGAGEHVVAWHGRDASGRAVASGAYLLRLMVNGETSSRKLVLAR